MAKGKPKADCRADNRGGAWAGIPVCVVTSAAYRHLSVHARAALVEIVATMNGYNNGEITISTRQMREALGCSPRVASDVFAELMAHGFLDIGTDARHRQRLAREYRLTFVSMKDRSATNDYLHWSADTPHRKAKPPPRAKSGATYAVAEGGLTATYAVAEPEHAATYAVAEQTADPQKTANSENGVCYRIGSAYIIPYPSGDAGGMNTRPHLPLTVS